MKDFKDLRVWSKAHSLTIDVYKATRQFPKEELFGITSQMRRAAASVGANIAEGAGRKSDGELTRFLHIARGSAAELEYHLLLAHDLDLLSKGVYGLLARQTDEVQRMLTSACLASPACEESGRSLAALRARSSKLEAHPPLREICQIVLVSSK